MRKDDDFSLSTHSLRTVGYIRKGVLYGIVKKSVKIRKLFLYAFFTGSLGIRKFEISCCAISSVAFDTNEISSSSSDAKMNTIFNHLFTSVISVCSPT